MPQDEAGGGLGHGVNVHEPEHGLDQISSNLPKVLHILLGYCDKKKSGNSKQYWGSCCSKHGHQGDLFEHVVVADQDEVDHHVFVVVYMHQKL